MLRKIFIYLFLLNFLSSNCWSSGVDANPTLLSLEECISIVLTKNPKILSAFESHEEQLANLSSSRKDLLPSLSFQYSYTRQPTNARSGLSAVPEDYYNYNFTIEQPLFRGRSLLASVEKNKLAVVNAEIDIERTNDDTVLLVHQAYYGLLRAMKLETEADQVVKRLEKHREDANNYFTAGLIPKNDLLQSEVELAYGKQLQLKARNFRLLSVTKLNLLLDLPPDQDVTIEDSFSYDYEPTVWESALDQALSSRPEIRQVEISVQQLEKDIIVVQADYLPEVTLSATYEKQGDSPAADYYPTGASEVKTAQAIAKWKLWSWRQGKDKVSAARHRVNKLRQESEKIKDEVTLQVREAFLNREETVENIRVTQKAVEQAEENYRLVDERYMAQMASSTEVLDAQTLLARSRISYFNAIYDYNMADISLRWASGTISVKK